MMQYLLTGLAGLALGVVIMRLMQSAPASQATGTDREANEADGDAHAAEATGQAAAAPQGLRAWSATHKLLAGSGALGLAALALLLLRSPDESQQLEQIINPHSLLFMVKRKRRLRFWATSIHSFWIS